MIIKTSSPTTKIIEERATKKFKLKDVPVGSLVKVETDLGWIFYDHNGNKKFVLIADGYIRSEPSPNWEYEILDCEIHIK